MDTEGSVLEPDSADALPHNLVDGLKDIEARIVLEEAKKKSRQRITQLVTERLADRVGSNLQLAMSYNGGESSFNPDEKPAWWWVGAAMQPLKETSYPEKAGDLAMVWQVIGENIQLVAPADTNMILADYLDYIRSYITSADVDPAAILNTPEMRSPYALYTAVEYAYAGDYVTAMASLEKLDNQDPLKAYLKQLLMESETSRSPSSISEKESHTNLDAIKKLARSEDQLSQPQSISINTTPKVVETVIGAFSNSRLLSSSEFASSGGNISRVTNNVRDSSYRKVRREKESKLGFSGNIFVPPPIYGSLTTSAEPLGGAAQYGNVEIVLKQEMFDDSKAVFIWGDSLSIHPEERRINAHDASIAHGLLPSQPNQDQIEVEYIEAILQGVRVGDIAEIKILSRLDSENLEDHLQLLSDVALRGIGAILAINWEDTLALAGGQQNALRVISQLATSNPKLRIEVQFTGSHGEAEASAELQQLNNIVAKDYSGMTESARKRYEVARQLFSKL